MSSLVNELIAARLLLEVGQGESAGGKPPTLLALNERAREIIAVDLGHEPFLAALVDLAGHIHVRKTAPVSAPTGEEALEVAAALIEAIISAATEPILGIGIGSPGVIAPDGRVLEASNLAWHGLDLGADLRRRFDIPISIANDAAMAALAEFRRQPDMRNLILVKLGRGVGAGLVLDGALYRGQHSAAGEIGHVRVREDGALCACGHTGCLETVASVPSIISGLGGDPEQDPWDALALSDRFGDDAVRSALAAAGRAVGAALAGVVATLDVSHIVLAPELLNADEILVEAVCDELSSRMLPSTAELVEVEATRLGGDLVLVGAASAVLVDRIGAVL